MKITSSPGTYLFHTPRKVNNLPAFSGFSEEEKDQQAKLLQQLIALGGGLRAIKRLYLIGVDYDQPPNYGEYYGCGVEVSPIKAGNHLRTNLDEPKSFFADSTKQAGFWR